MQKRLTWCGLVISLLYIAAIVILVWGRLPSLKFMTLNEIGDFFAGVFGPLTILWLILGYLQQGQELKVSSDALLLQARELNNSVRQQEELVAVSRQQLNAELEARKLDEERKAAAARSNIKISGNRVGRDMLGEKVDFVFRNIGEVAQDVSVYLVGEEGRKPILEAPVIERGKKESTYVSIPVLDGLRVRVDYSDPLDGRTSRLYKIEVLEGVSHLNFVLEELAEF